MVTLVELNTVASYLGLSTDTKPTVVSDSKGIPNGSRFIEMDTGKKFFWNVDNMTWVEKPSSSGGGGGSSNLELLASESFTVNTTSTLYAVEGYIELGSSAWTSDWILFTHIRGRSGPRNGYFYGYNSIFINSYPISNPAATGFSPSSTAYIKFLNDKYIVSQGDYGIYAYKIFPDGKLEIRSRYNSNNTGTIDDTFDVNVYKLTLPDGVTLFDEIPVLG